MKEKRKAHQNYMHSKTNSDKYLDFDQSETANPTFEANEDLLVSSTIIILVLFRHHL